MAGEKTARRESCTEYSKKEGRVEGDANSHQESKV